MYLLLGPRDDGEGEKLYIGEGDPIRPRLESHYAQKDFWTRAVCFVAAPGQLNKAHVQFLEANLVRLAKAAKRMPLDNGNAPAEPTLSEADRADMQVFLQNMLGMLPVLGVQAFEQAPPAAATAATLLTCKGKGVLATGYESSQGFVVKAGSHAVAESVPSMQQHVRGMFELRQELIGNGVLAADGRRLPLFAGLRVHVALHRRGGGAGAQRQRAHRVEGCAGADVEGIAGAGGGRLTSGAYHTRIRKRAIPRLKSNTCFHPVWWPAALLERASCRTFAICK